MMYDRLWVPTSLGSTYHAPHRRLAIFPDHTIVNIFLRNILSGHIRYILKAGYKCAIRDTNVASSLMECSRLYASLLSCRISRRAFDVSLANKGSSTGEYRISDSEDIMCKLVKVTCAGTAVSFFLYLFTLLPSTS